MLSFLFSMSVSFGQDRLILPNQTIPEYFPQQGFHQIEPQVAPSPFRKSSTDFSKKPHASNKTTAVSSVGIGSSSNAYSFVRTVDHQLSLMPGLGGGTLAFIYRQNINIFGGPPVDNGKLRYRHFNRWRANVECGKWCFEPRLYLSQSLS